MQLPRKNNSVSLTTQKPPPKIYSKWHCVNVCFDSFVVVVVIWCAFLKRLCTMYILTVFHACFFINFDQFKVYLRSSCSPTFDNDSIDSISKSFHTLGWNKVFMQQNPIVWTVCLIVCFVCFVFIKPENVMSNDWKSFGYLINSRTNDSAFVVTDKTGYFQLTSNPFLFLDHWKLIRMTLKCSLV